jgi:hypothetical protein
MFLASLGEQRDQATPMLPFLGAMNEHARLATARPSDLLVSWWARQVLNLRPLACEASQETSRYVRER